MYTAHMTKEKAWDKPNPKKNLHHHLSPREKVNAKEWATRHHVPYPSFVANVHDMQHKKKK